MGSGERQSLLLREYLRSAAEDKNLLPIPVRTSEIRRNLAEFRNACTVDQRVTYQVAKAIAMLLCSKDNKPFEWCSVVRVRE